MKYEALQRTQMQLRTKITKLQKRAKPAGPIFSRLVRFVVKACGQTVPQDPNGSYHCADIIHLKLTNLEKLHFLHFATVQRKSLAALAAIFPQ